MYCYECARQGKIRYVSLGLGKCTLGHNVHVGLDKELELPNMIEKIINSKKIDDIEYIRTFIQNEKRN